MSKICPCIPSVAQAYKRMWTNMETSANWMTMADSLLLMGVQYEKQSPYLKKELRKLHFSYAFFIKILYTEIYRRDWVTILISQPKKCIFPFISTVEKVNFYTNFSCNFNITSHTSQHYFITVSENINQTQKLKLLKTFKTEQMIWSLI